MPAASELAYSALLQRIQQGMLAPGAFLVEADLAQEIGVSRTPVREALRRLAAEGLVQTEGRRRASVREFPDRAVDELYELRIRLEGLAAARAAERIGAEGIARLTALATAMERCANLQPPDTAGFAELNDAFHQQILDAADSGQLATALRPVLQIQLVMLQRYRDRIDEHLQRSNWHHRELIRAFELADPELAESQMRVHMMSARARGRRVPT